MVQEREGELLLERRFERRGDQRALLFGAVHDEFRLGHILEVEEFEESVHEGNRTIAGVSGKQQGLFRKTHLPRVCTGHVEAALPKLSREPCHLGTIVIRLIGHHDGDTPVSVLQLMPQHGRETQDDPIWAADDVLAV